MKRQKPVWTIRVIMREEGEPAFAPHDVVAYENIGRFLDVLQTAGVVTVLAEFSNEEPNRRVLEIPPPKDEKDSQQWAARNAQIMRTHGFNAVHAPMWDKTVRAAAVLARKETP